MATNSKVSVTKAQNENHRRILQALLKLDDNRRCADCQARGPTWASVNLGVFVCLNCSGIHRSLGTHLSKVRSTTLDTWLSEQVAFVELMGNRRANLFWEERLPKAFHRPAEGDMEGLKHFVGAKYRDQSYCSQQYGAAPTIDNFSGHPFMAQHGAVQGNAAAAAVSSAAEGPSSTVAAALNSRNSAPAAAPVPVAAKPAEPAATASSFDLLSMDDDTSAPSSAPAAASSQRDSDGGWAAFESSMAPSPAAPPAAPAAEDRWDAFPSAAAAPTSRAAGTALPPRPPQPSQQASRGSSHNRNISATSGASSELDLFSDPSLVLQPEYGHARQRSTESAAGSLHAPHSSQGSQSDLFADFTAAPQPNSTAASYPAGLQQQSAPQHSAGLRADASASSFASFPEPAAAQAPQGSAKGKHSASDILKMFDRPAQPSFADFGQQPGPSFAAFGQQVAPGALPGLQPLGAPQAPIMLAGVPAYGQPGLTSGFPTGNGGLF